MSTANVVVLRGTVRSFTAPWRGRDKRKLLRVRCDDVFCSSLKEFPNGILAAAREMARRVRPHPQQFKASRSAFQLAVFYGNGLVIFWPCRCAIMNRSDKHLQAICQCQRFFGSAVVIQAEAFGDFRDSLARISEDGRYRKPKWTRPGPVHRELCSSQLQKLLFPEVVRVKICIDSFFSRKC